MDTVEITLAVPDLEHDRYIGLLGDRATGFRQTQASLTAYVPAHAWSERAREQLADRLREDGYGEALTVRPLRTRNWNAAWEDSIPSVRVGPFFLCGRSAEVPPEHADATPLRIDPQMSFGTGHHATTRLALRLLAGAVAEGDRVLDVGTGTGVLAIAACRLGAHSVFAVDTSPKAVANARENVAGNEVGDCVTVREGSMEATPDDHAGVVLANITRDTLLNLLPAIRSRLAPGGVLILSGLLTSDRGRMRKALGEHGLSVDEEATEDGWWAARARPSP
jgi:ribosomal protein L11 methyltransferase